MQNKSSWRGLTRSMLIVGGLLSVIGFAADKYDSRIQSYALIPYTQGGYPETIAEFGLRLSEVENYRRRVAEIVLDSGKCDKVEFVELSTESSLQKLNFWADCTNGHRIYLTESEIDTSSTVFTQQDKVWSKKMALKACHDAIKNRALLPSELDIHNFTGTHFYTAPLTYNVVLKINFEAKNIFGDYTPFTATCYFEPGKVGEIVISERND